MSPPADDLKTGGLARVRSMLLTTVSVEIVVLVVTGIALYFVYVPTQSQAWGDIFGPRYDGGARLAIAVRVVHRLTSVLLLPTALAAGMLLTFRSRPGARRWTGAALGVGITLTTVAVSITGYLLPWDQLALWAVTVGTNFRGYGWLGDDSVRFVLLGGVEITKGALLRWLVVHALVLTPVLVALVALAIRRARPPRTPGT